MTGPIPPAATTAADEAADPLHQAARALLERGNQLSVEEETGERLELRSGVGQRHPIGLPAVVLEHAHGRVALALESEPQESPLGDLRWHDYQGEARILAWTLSHEELVQRLADLFGAGLLPTAFREPGQGQWVWLALDWHDADGQSSHGWLGLDAPALSRLAAHPEWRTSDDHISLLGDADSVALNLLLPGRPLEAATVAALEPGDVLLLGTEDGMEGSLMPDRDTARQFFGLPDAWAVQRLGGRWVVVDRPAAQAPAHRPQFLLTRITMSPQDVEGLHPGSTVTGDGLLVGSTAGIMLGGRRFGEGVVVGLGELLGVRITNKEGEHGFL